MTNQQQMDQMLTVQELVQRDRNARVMAIKPWLSGTYLVTAAILNTDDTPIEMVVWTVSTRTGFVGNGHYFPATAQGLRDAAALVAAA